MRKMLKKVMTIFTAGVMALGAASLAACGNGFTPPAGGPSGTDAVESNGGFVVKKGEYLYFINGVETYTADNTYGSPVKGALMRIKESDALAGNNTSETVVPSLMVAADYTSGIYVYGDRVYYATPNNVRDVDSVIQNSYLDFKSAKLDGSDVESYFYVSSNSTVYRFVEVDGTVYLLYVADSAIHSYNLAKGTDTVLASGIGEYLLDSIDKQNPTVYYTMTVTPDLDVEDSGASAREYTQVYRVRADATEAPYTYEWRQDYLDEHEDEPYVNLGEIVLDGIGRAYAENGNALQFTHDLADGVTPVSPAGFTYTLQSYTNGGIYFTRSDLTTTSSVGEDGWLFYLSEDKIDADGWNSVSGNAKGTFDVVAQNTTNAGTSAIFYLEDGKHHYLYVSNGTLFRADVKADGSGTAEALPVARGIGSATLLSIDASSDQTYRYVYYTVSGDAGNNVFRAVYNGDEEDYKALSAKDAYQPVQVLDVEHARSWYNCEIIGGVLYIADAEAIGSDSYNYIAAVDLRTESGALMNNEQLKAYNETYNEVMGEEGYLEELNDAGKNNLATAVRYYFYTGETEQFYANIEEAEEQTGKTETLYSADEVKEFEAYTSDETKTVRGNFLKAIGKVSESDAEAIGEYWKTTLQHYTYPAETDTGLAGWAWALIAIAIVLVLAGAGVAVWFLLRKRGGEEKPGKEKMYVDTTDDKDVDVYADDEPVQPEEEAAEEQPEETPEEEAAEAPEEEPAEEEPEEEEPAEAPSGEEAPETEETPETPEE